MASRPAATEVETQTLRRCRNGMQMEKEGRGNGEAVMRKGLGYGGRSSI